MFRVLTLATLFFAAAGAAVLVTIKPYPGARADEELSGTATTMLVAFGEKATKLKATVYLTDDSFDQVTAHYLKQGKETIVPSNKPEEFKKTPSGQPIQEMYVIFDGAADIVVSNAWAKIQRPFVRSYGMVDGKPFMEGIRDATVITVVQSK